MSSVQPTHLAALIDETRLRNGASDEDVARKSRAMGNALTRSDISKFRLEGMPTLVPRKIRALADGLELPPWRVAVAALADHGIRVPLDKVDVETAIRADGQIPAIDRELLLQVLERAYARDNPRPARRRSTKS